jgi:hypothetical protein
MDSLSHLLISLAGGLLIIRFLKIKGGLWKVSVYAILSLLIDVDHILTFFGITKILLLHNLFAITLISAMVWLIRKNDEWLLLWSMLLGHLLMDMHTGVYGIPILLPLSTHNFLIPAFLELWFLGDPSYPIVSKTGIAFFLYGLILAIIAFASYRKSR